MRSSHTRLRTAGTAIGAVLAMAGCATHVASRVIVFPETTARPVAHIDGIFTHASALATIGAIFERDLDLPRVSAIVYFSPDARAVEAALLASGHDPALARAGATRLRAIAAPQRVIVNEAKLSELSWPAQVASLAHELVHCLQYELGGGRRGTSEQWVREGFAEWVAIRVLEQLRALEPGAARRLLADELRASNRSRAPRFDDMVTFPQWVALGGRRDIAPQAQATLAVDALIARHGVPAILGYFTRFATSDDRAENFRAAFGDDRSAFEANLNLALGLRRN